MTNTSTSDDLIRSQGLMSKVIVPDSTDNASYHLPSEAAEGQAESTIEELDTDIHGEDDEGSGGDETCFVAEVDDGSDGVDVVPDDDVGEATAATPKVAAGTLESEI
jgi:hypothetical protein